MKLTIEELQHILDTYDGGVLSSGAHSADSGQYCALEAVSLAQAVNRKDAHVYRSFTDNPTKLGMPDLRPLNDARWSSSEVRTQALLPLIAALSDWAQWSSTRQQQWAKIVSINTVKRVISELPYFPDNIRE